MVDDFVKNKKIWVPDRIYGVCVWFTSDGIPLSDGDGILCAEGFVGDKGVENRVKDAARYWSGSTDGYCQWIHGARKVSQSERDDQAERLSMGLVADPYEDAIEQAIRSRQ